MDYYHGRLPFASGQVKVGQLIGALCQMGVPIMSPAQNLWEELGLSDYDPDRVVTRLEAAVLVDATIHPFSMFGVDYDGNIKTY